MSLKKLQLPTETLAIGDETIVLRGLSLPDVTTLIRNHGPALEGIFAKLQTQMGKDSETDFDLAGILNDLSTTAPLAIAEIIALSAGEPDAVPEATVLPFPVQLEAIEKISRITFATEGGVKNFAETVIRLAKSLSGTLAQMNARENQTPSTVGTVDSLAA